MSSQDPQEQQQQQEEEQQGKVADAPKPPDSDQQENDPRGEGIEGGSASAGQGVASEANPPASEESVGEGTDTSSA